MPRISNGKKRDGSGGGRTMDMSAIYKLTNKLAAREFSHPLSEYWIGLAISQELLTLKMRRIMAQAKEQKRCNAA